MKRVKQMNMAEALPYARQFSDLSPIFILVHNDETSREAELTTFSQTDPTIYYFACQEGKAKGKMARFKEFLNTILHVLGQPEQEETASAKYRRMLDVLSGQLNPVIILDNADALDTYAIHLLYQLYNDKRANVVLAGSTQFMRRIQERAAKRKDVYAGFENRIFAYLIVD